LLLRILLIVLLLFNDVLKFTKTIFPVYVVFIVILTLTFLSFIFFIYDTNRKNTLKYNNKSTNSIKYRLFYIQLLIFLIIILVIIVSFYQFCQYVSKHQISYSSKILQKSKTTPRNPFEIPFSSGHNEYSDLGLKGVYYDSRNFHIFFRHNIFQWNSSTSFDIVCGVKQNRAHQDFVGWFQTDNKLVIILIDGHHTDTLDQHNIALNLFKNIQNYEEELDQLQNMEEYRQFIYSWYKYEIIDKMKNVDERIRTKWGVCFDMVLIGDTESWIFHHGDTRIYIQQKDSSSLGNNRTLFTTLPEYNWTSSEMKRVEPFPGIRNTKLKKFTGETIFRYNRLNVSRSLGDLSKLSTVWDDTYGNDLFPLQQLDITSYQTKDLNYILMTSDGIGTKIFDKSETEQFNHFVELLETKSEKVSRSEFDTCMVKYDNGDDDQSFCLIRFNSSISHSSGSVLTRI